MLIGGAGDDTLFGGRGFDRVQGRPGDDRLDVHGGGAYDPAGPTASTRTTSARTAGLDGVERSCEALPRGPIRVRVRFRDRQGYDTYAKRWIVTGRPG